MREKMFRKYKIQQLFRAVRENNLEETQKLIDRMDNLNVREKIFGNSLLHEAESLEMVELLLKAGANPNVLNASKKTAVEYARNKEIADLLLSSGAFCDKEIDELERTILYNVFSF